MHIMTSAKIIQLNGDVGMHHAKIWKVPLAILSVYQGY